ncbi:VIT domain-containing protein [uncultured Stenotrophomonas sp.]|uniref:VIT domain-containing protein n=1 Tax=uncultured Stenotrophomonas sp. TaxID=165438 RepID=UPI0028F06059|nr:VIT domain-containing protein [uncultured Stenotrophomonas sp.]
MDSLLRRIGLGFVVWVGTVLGQGATAQQMAGPVLKVAGAEQPVLLEQARIDSHVAGGLGETRIELVFRNPNRRVLEGSLEFPLAEGQKVTGFALDIGGALRDAVPVPKAQGRQVFEAIERRGVDPGLLEQTAGNQFRLRIYPIPALGTRRVVITLREALPVEAKGLRWTLPLQFAREAQSVQLNVDAAGSGVPVANGRAPVALALREGAWQAHWQGRGTALPAQLGWTLPLPRGVDAVRGTFDGEQYVMVQVPVPVQAQARALPRRVGLLWDASGSARHRDTAAELAVLDRYFASIGNGEVQLTVLRDRAEPTRRFEVRQGDWNALRRHLEALPRDGASALGDWTAQADVDEYLLVSDGLANYGKRERPALRPGQRLYALSGAGARTDSERLRAWTRAGHGQLLVVGGAGDVDAAASRLLRGNPADVVADGEGVADLRVDTDRADHGWVRVLGRVQRADAVLRLQLPAANGTRRTVSVPLADARDAGGGLVAHAWADGQRRALAADPAANRAALQALSQRFGLVGADTSLLVLETLDDYLRYGIRPAAPLRQEYDRLHAVSIADDAAARRKRLDTLAAQFAERELWWNRSWPKGAPPVAASMKALSAPMPAGAPPPPAPAPAMMLAAESEQRHREASRSATLDRVEVTAARQQARAEANADAFAAEADAPAADDRANRGALKISVAAWAPDSDYARRLRAARPDAVYALYLQERDDHADSSAFYLDVADILLAHGQRDLALRVLSNLAEMQLENRHVLRVLGYRLMQAKAAALAVPVFRDVLALGEEEPQSFRDLALALEADNQPAEALAAFNEVVVRPWDSRFDGISLIALDELTTLVARTGVDARAVDPRLRRAMPLDLRVVLSWDSDNSDMDLWVTDPNGERAYYGNRLTYQGGQMSRDFTGGYGPEQFSLRQAKPGRYKVEANYFGSREQLVTGATTLTLRLSTHWGSRRQQDQQVTMRLKDDSETVLVGEFEVR